MEPVNREQSGETAGEPSVLEYMKEKLAFWRPSTIHIPSSIEKDCPDVRLHEMLVEPVKPASGSVVETKEISRTFPWRSSAALIVALFAQIMLEPPDQALTSGVVLYLMAAGLIVWGVLTGEWALAALKPDERVSTQGGVRRDAFVAGAALTVLGFFAFSSGTFTPFNLIIWLLAIGLSVRAFWEKGAVHPWENRFARVKRFLSQPTWKVAIPRWLILFIAAFLVAVFFRFYRLNQVPAEMVSDHAEKLLDVWDVLQGKLSVYFPRNTGREAFQFYLTAAVILIFNTGLSFLSLKIGTGLAGLATLPFIYLLGKEVGNRRAGLYAMLLAGIAYWPNVISRIALRFTLYPLFVAPALYFLVRGLRRSSRNDFILSGIALGIGLHGYTSIRILPFVIVAAVLLYLIHRQSKGARQQAILNLAILSWVSFVVFLPLFRYAVAFPDLFAFRAFSRVGTVERALPGSAPVIFLQNLWNAMTMFFWSDGVIWVHSIPLRPALDVVSAVFFFIGSVLVLVRYLRNRNWIDLFLLLAVPMLMLPSILSLAFPGENPSLNRTGGAIVPVFVLTGLGLDALLTALRERLPGKRGAQLAGVVLSLLLIWSAAENYSLVFQQYDQQYRASAWNTSEMGQILHDFSHSIGSADSAWVVAYPYWVDTRLVGINAGYPTKDYAISPDQIPLTITDLRTKLFIVNMEDDKGLSTLRKTYPQGTLSTYTSQVATKDFYLYLVPAATGSGK